MTEDIVLGGFFFFTIIVIVIGLPLVRAYVRQRERTPVLTPADRDRDERLARIEAAVETMAVEVERVAEGQRFVTRLLAEREPSKPLPAPHDERR